MPPSHPELEAPRVAGKHYTHTRRPLQCTFKNCLKRCSSQSSLTQHILWQHQAHIQPSPSPRSQQVPASPQIDTAQADHFDIFEHEKVLDNGIRQATPTAESVGGASSGTFFFYYITDSS